MQLLKQLLRQQPQLAYALHALRQAFAAERQVAVRTPHGFRIAGNRAMQSGDFEREEAVLIAELLATHDRLIDCGANIGYFTCLARQLDKHALAVEPLAANLSLLMANLVENGWSDTEIAPVGLGRDVGIVEIFGSDTGASLVPGWATLPQNTLMRERIALNTLDNVVGSRFLQEKLLIKVDVEGGERALLEGAANILVRRPSPTWIVEICLTENFPGGNNPDFSETFGIFFNSGYRAYAATGAKNEVTAEDIATWSRDGRAQSATYNYLFVRDDR